jgi:hypothetical protein
MDLSLTIPTARQIVTVTSDGHCQYGFTAIITISCSFRVANFPNDVQHCNMSFLPNVAYDTKEIVLGAGAVAGGIVLQNSGGYNILTLTFT